MATSRSLEGWEGTTRSLKTKTKTSSQARPERPGALSSGRVVQRARKDGGTPLTCDAPWAPDEGVGRKRLQIATRGLRFARARSRYATATAVAKVRTHARPGLPRGATRTPASLAQASRRSGRRHLLARHRGKHRRQALRQREFARKGRRTALRLSSEPCDPPAPFELLDDAVGQRLGALQR